MSTPAPAETFDAPGADQGDPSGSVPFSTAQSGHLPQAGFLRTAPSGYDQRVLANPGGSSAALNGSVAALAQEVAASLQSTGMGAPGQPYNPPPLHGNNMPPSGNPLFDGGAAPVVPDRGSLPAFMDPSAPPAQPQPPQPQQARPRDLAARFRDGAPPPVAANLEVAAPPPIDPSLERIEINDPNDPRVAHTFARLRTDLRAQHQYATSIAESAKAAQKAADEAKRERDSITAILEAERTRNKELDEQVSKLSLVESPSFRAKFDAPLDDVVAKATKFILDGGMARDARDAEKRAKDLLVADAADIVEATETLPKAVVNQMVAMASKFSELQGERERALKDWKVAKTASAKSYDMVSTEERLQMRRQMAEKALEHARTVSPVLAAASQRDVTAAREIESQFTAFAQHASEEELMRCASEGFVAQEMYDELNQLRAQYAELRARVDGRRLAGQPPIGPTFTPPAPYAPPPAPAPYVPPNVRVVNANPNSSRSYLETIVAPQVEEARAPFRQRGRF